MVAIRNACAALGTFQLRVRDVHELRAVPDVPGGDLLVALRGDLLRQHCGGCAAAGFDDSFLYEEMKRPLDERKIPADATCCRSKAISSFEAWRDSGRQNRLLNMTTKKKTVADK